MFQTFYCRSLWCLAPAMPTPDGTCVDCHQRARRILADMALTEEHQHPRGVLARISRTSEVGYVVQG